MKIDSLKPGMTVYDVHSHRAGNTVMRTWGVWDVKILAVFPDSNTVIASWNGNEPRTFYSSAWKAWRKTAPTLVKTGFGLHRLQTREEKKGKKHDP